MRFVQPARLRDAQSEEVFAARRMCSKGPVRGEGQFVLQAQIARHAPKQQTRRTRQQMQLFAQIRLLDARRQRGEGTEREQETNRTRPLILRPQIRFRPARQRLLAPVRPGEMFLHRQNAEAGLAQIGQFLQRDAIDRVQ